MKVTIKLVDFSLQVFLGMLFHNENTNEGIQSVLEAVHKYMFRVNCMMMVKRRNIQSAKPLWAISCLLRGE